MFKLRARDAQKNLCGGVIARLRHEQKPHLSQRALAKRLQMAGYDMDHFAIRKIENRSRFVTDIELRAFAHVFDVSVDELASKDEMPE